MLAQSAPRAVALATLLSSACEASQGAEGFVNDTTAQRDDAKQQTLACGFAIKFDGIPQALHFRLPDSLVELEVMLAARVLLRSCILWHIPISVKDCSVTHVWRAATSANACSAASISSGDCPGQELRLTISISSFTTCLRHLLGQPSASQGRRPRRNQPQQHKGNGRARPWRPCLTKQQTNVNPVKFYESEHM